MLKKLRKKFILVNMLCVTSILLAVLSVFFVLYCRNSVRNSGMFMKSVLQRTMRNEKRNVYRLESPDQKDRDKDREPGPYLPYVVYRVEADGSAEFLESLNFEIPEELTDTLINAAEEDRTKGSSFSLFSLPEDFHPEYEQLDSGYLAPYKLRYILSNEKNGSGAFHIIFADMSYVRSSAFGYLLTFLGIFLVAAFLFFLLSFWFSGWALAPAEKAWEQQNRFVADASHELKTPLTVILANLGILSAHPEDTVRKQLRWVTNTKEEAERMRVLVEDLLFLAKSDAGVQPPAFQEVDFTNCAEDRALNFEAVAFEKDVSLFSEVAEGLRLRGNEGELKQLLTILLDNAVKYAGTGGEVRLTIKKKQDKILLSVQNTGDPVDPEDLPHIFERFYRADKSRARKEGGYGLGLSIAENIVRRHKGSIRCESSREQGTVFTVELPAL